MSLLIDIGNTRLKWMFSTQVGKEVAVNFIAVENDNVEMALLQLKELVADTIEDAFYSSVKSDLFNEAFSQAFLKIFGVAPKLALSRKSQNGLVNVYQDYGKLGVDRWLAMLGAWEQVGKKSAFAVIDSGTALTIDLVDLEGHHLGGFIIPGRHLMIKSIFGETDKVFYLKTDQDLPNKEWGINSTQAVLGGVDFAQIAIVEKAIAEIKRELGKCVIFLTGGGIDRVISHLKKDSQYKLKTEDIKHEPNLVLKGLSVYESTLPDAVG